MNLKTIFQSIKKLIFSSVDEKYKREFDIEISRINVSRAIATTIVFIIVEVILLGVSFAVKGQAFLKPPSVYHGAMYILMIVVMLLYLIAFIRQGKNVPKNVQVIVNTGISFACFILLWCAVTSLIDQLSSNQIIVYVVAIISVAVCPFYKPFALLCIYCNVQAVFIILLPYFQTSAGMLFSDYVNSTSFIIVSWVISRMRYKACVEDFINKKEIQNKSDELERLNRELEKANVMLERLSCTDGLTGIANRFMFDRVIKAEWDRCKRHFSAISLFMIDIDLFKEYNDGYGHQAGDKCLRQIAEVLSSKARRSSDTVARYGGEEFAIILPDLDKENAYLLAEKIRRGVEELAIKHEYSSVSDYVTISIGVCTTIPSDKSSVEELISNADKALYRAKENSRNSTVVA